MPEEIADEALNPEVPEVEVDTPDEAVETDQPEVEEESPVEDIEPEVRTKVETQDVEDDEEIDPEDQKRIAKIVDKQVGTKIQEVENKMELNSFVSNNPEFTKYQNVILKHMSHPAYKNIPIKKIAYMVASEDLIKLGAQRERETQTKVNKTVNPGSTVRKPAPTTTVDWKNASTAEFLAKKAEIFSKR